VINLVTWRDYIVAKSRVPGASSGFKRAAHEYCFRGVRLSGSEFRFSGFGFRVSGMGLRVFSGFGYGASDLFGFQVSGGHE